MIKFLQIIILVVFSLLMLSSSCDKGSEGCTDPLACNYDNSAAIDNGSCWYRSNGCFCEDPIGSVIDCLGVCDADISNDPEDTDNDGICNDDVIGGCIDSTNCRYSPDITHNDGSCAPNLSDFGGLQNGTDCNGICDGRAVLDNCDLCIGGETNLGESWRLKIISEVTFKLSNGLNIGSDKDSVILGSSIFAENGYNGTEINEGDPSCNACYIDFPEPPITGFENKKNFIRFYFPHNENEEWEEWGSQFDIEIEPLFDRDIRANDYYSLFTYDVGLNWYAEIKPILSDTTIVDNLGNISTYSSRVDSVRLEFIYLEGISSEESDKFSINVFLDREKGEVDGGVAYKIEGDKLSLLINSDNIIKLSFQISNLCFSEYD